MSLDIDLPDSLDIEKEVYHIDPDEPTSANAVTGVAKRRFNDDHGTSHCRATKLFDKKGIAYVVAVEDPIRDYLDSYAIQAVQEYPEVTERAKHGSTEEGRKQARAKLVEVTMDLAFAQDGPQEVRERVERTLEMI